MDAIALSVLKLRVDNFSKYLANVDPNERGKLKRSLPFLYSQVLESEKDIADDQKLEYSKIIDDCKRLAEQLQVKLNPDKNDKY